MGGIGHIYIGSPYQRGHGGIGSFLAGIFRRVLPLITRGARAVGKEAVRTGFNIMSDVATHNRPINESFRNRMRESGEVLKRKAEEKLDKLMEGSGYKIPRYGNPAQLQLLAGPAIARDKRRRRKHSGRVKKRGIRKVASKKKNKSKRKTVGRRKKKSSTKQKRKNRTTRDIFGR